MTSRSGEQAVDDLHLAVVVSVIHRDSLVGCDEVVIERLARLDEVLRPAERRRQLRCPEA